MITESAVFYSNAPMGFQPSIVPQPLTVAPAVPQTTLGELVKLLVIAKASSNRRSHYVRHLSDALSLFIRGKENRLASTLTAEEVEAFLSGYPNTVTRNCKFTSINTMFRWGVKRGLVDKNPMDRLDRPLVDRKTPEILTVHESEKLLRTTQKEHPERLPFLVLLLLLGCRPTFEATGVCWSDVAEDYSHIIIKAESAKIRGRRRLVRMEPSAQTWLKKAKEIGGVLPVPRASKRVWMKGFTAVLGWAKWKQDICRHTAISFWVAKRQDVPYVALQCGNSSSVIHRFYLDIVSAEDAAKFWAIMP